MESYVKSNHNKYVGLLKCLLKQRLFYRLRNNYRMYKRICAADQLDKFFPHGRWINVFTRAGACADDDSKVRKLADSIDICQLALWYVENLHVLFKFNLKYY